jgi:hypothetical protein
LGGGIGMNSCYGARYSSGPYSKYDQTATRKRKAEKDLLLQKVQRLEEAGDRMARRLFRLIINSERTPDNASIDAVKSWWKAKEESE